ncbi:teichuronic acid biosynthesis protein TuaB [archaeon BMS3Abin17]|nr:teichuronic acid biosynthesis protein TuaB [archaeon BMS3Abin17]HDZ61225.1 flippase [Candidatus Pacearchaeota archaeon]
MGKVSRKVVSESLWKFVSTIITKAGALIFVVLLARFLRPEGFGVYNLAMAIVLTFTLLTDLGVNRTLLRYFSFSLGKKDKSKAVAYARYLFKIKFLIVTVFSILFLVLAYPLSFWVFKKPELFWPLIILSIYLVVLSFEMFFEYFFYAIKKIKFLTIKEVFLQALRISFALLVFAFLMGYNRILGIFVAVLFAHLFTSIFLFVLLKKHVSFIFEKSESKINKKKLFSFLKYLAVGGISAMFFVYVDIIMLGIFLPSTYVGYYSAAVALVGALIFLIPASNVLLPVFTQLKKGQLKNSFDKVFKYVCLLSIPVIFGALAVGRYFIRVFYGYEYLPSLIPLYFLVFLVFSEVLTGTLISLFSAREKPQYFVKYLLIFSALNVILNYFLIKFFINFSFELAMVGAAIATLTTRYSYMIALGIISVKKLNINYKLTHFVKPLIASILMFLAIFYINYTIKDMTLLLGLGEILLGVFVYFILMFLMKGFRKEDFQMIKDAIKNL